jgi:hypothetical protein
MTKLNKKHYEVLDAFNNTLGYFKYKWQAKRYIKNNLLCYAVIYKRLPGVSR